MYTTIMVINPINTDATECTRSMVLISIDENREMTQKYASLVCDIIIDPAPMASTVSNLPLSVSRPSGASKGKTIEAAVMIATVEDPCAVLSMQVSRNGNQIPAVRRSNVSLK